MDIPTNLSTFMPECVIFIRELIAISLMITENKAVVLVNQMTVIELYHRIQSLATSMAQLIDYVPGNLSPRNPLPSLWVSNIPFMKAFPPLSCLSSEFLQHLRFKNLKLPLL